ncbi:hypothetical protein [Thermoactinomyces sp. CICC 10523]|uniref:hypothetical protein n=1 Tax=Thermoactinomyces sp. CICC 10523 TaxID=2767428 RepID=UPI0018DC3A5C|nr:hypothetical protein [Thermoactinomyces sp. CICC 10523]MBH8599599.1 hypothetical protein [Thermoactinomyces sp. CICC 10523]
MMRLATKVLNAGGLAIKVETAGLALSKEDWKKLCQDLDIVSLYYAFVKGVVEKDYFYSCGMHQFGQRDVLIYDQWDRQLMDQFLLYVLIEQPSLKVGETFSLGPDTPIYQIGEKACDQYEKDDLFYNPLGYWTLQRK